MKPTLQEHSLSGNEPHWKKNKISHKIKPGAPLNISNHNAMVSGNTYPISIPLISFILTFYGLVSPNYDTYGKEQRARKDTQIYYQYILFINNNEFIYIE